MSNFQGKLLHVTVVGFNKLKATKGTSQLKPYANIECGSIKFRSKTCTYGQQASVFQEDNVFSLIEGLKEIKISVHNSNNSNTFDDFIGSGKVQLEKVLSQGYDDRFWPLHSIEGGYAGQVQLKMHYSNPAGYPPALYSAPQYSNPPPPPQYSNPPPPRQYPPPPRQYSNPPPLRLASYPPSQHSAPLPPQYSNPPPLRSASYPPSQHSAPQYSNPPPPRQYSNPPPPRQYSNPPPPRQYSNPPPLRLASYSPSLHSAPLPPQYSNPPPLPQYSNPPPLRSAAYPPSQHSAPPPPTFRPRVFRGRFMSNLQPTRPG